MHSDKDNPATTQDSLEGSKETTLEWLMDLDRDEPEENLFTVEGKATELSLSAFEAEVAARPMTRGRAGADDLDTYISEEIVLSENGNTNGNGMAAEADSEDSDLDGLMAIDFSRQDEAEQESRPRVVDDGTDILGLADEDDMGESFMVVRRVPRDKEAEPVVQAAVNGDQREISTAAVDADSQASSETDAATPAVETLAEMPVMAAEAPQEIGEEIEMSAALDDVVEEIELEAVAGDELEMTLPGETGVPGLNDVEDVTTALDAVDAPEGDIDGLPVADVAAYVATVDAPQGDDAFDDFLVAGSELAVGEDDFDALVLGEEELAFSVDTNLDDDLELHDDFVSMDGFENDLMAVITPRVAPFMEEVNAAVSARLVALGRPGDAVSADVSVATDTETRAAAMQQGYEPVMAICGAVPDSLEGLQPAELDAVMLRLGEVATGEACNRLFQEDPATPDAPVSITPMLTVVENTVFDDDIFGEDIDGALPPQEWAPESEEIDAIFDDFGGDDDFSLEFDTPLPDAEEMAAANALELQVQEQVEELSIDVAGQRDSLSQADEELLIGPDTDTFEGSVDDGPIQVDGAAAIPDMVDEQELDAGPLQVFEEDLFETDLAEEESLEAASAEEIDRLLEDLGAETELAGEICGVEVEAFADSSANEELAVVEDAGEDVADVAISAVAGSAEDMSWCIPEGINFHHSSPSSGEIFAEFLDAFIEEGSSELEKLEDAVSAWEADIGSEQSYTQVTRILHTIKGIAKGVGLHFYGTLIHNFETLLERMPRPESGEEHDYFRIVNAWLDAAVRGLDFVQDQRRDIVSEFPVRGDSAEPVTVEEVVETETAAASTDTVLEDQPQVAETPVVQPVAAPRSEKDARRKQEDKQLADEGARALAAQQSVRITSEKLDLLLNLSNQAQQLGVRTAQSTTRNKRASAELMGRLSSVRAHIADIADRTLFNVGGRSANRSSELDALEMDQYSDLQEAANILREGVEDLADLIEVASRHNAQAEALLKQQASVIGSIGSTIRAARVVPVSRLMPGLRRLVRTVSNDLGKDVAFRVANEVGTLDRDDYTRCQTILEHMVRNALDHGIETTEERKATGKPSVGQITVDVRMSGADSVIVLSDDGRGIDPDAMRESAIRKGLDVDAYALSDDEARNLIFHKGFSTAQTLSQISGRGVGMDIVLSELQQMGGDIRIESAVGKGTSFHIRVPTNVTVNGALLVSAGDNSYAIPLGGLISVDEVPVEAFFSAVEAGENLQLSGLDCEPAYLGTLCQSCNLPDRSAWRHTVPVIVAGSESRYMAIAIDDVEEALELVIRSLGAQFASVPGVAGAATTADGEAVVALDLNVLVSCFAEGQGTAVADDQPEEEKFLALVVDDSRTQRMVATSQLETVGIETATAENGAVAIDWLNTTEHLPDVILLDVEMPVKDGIQTLREIRKSARYSHIPVIMVTSRTGIKHRTMAEEAGCNGYMGKPFNFRMLIGQINELTGQRLELG